MPQDVRQVVKKQLGNPGTKIWAPSKDHYPSAFERTGACVLILPPDLRATDYSSVQRGDRLKSQVCLALHFAQDLEL